MLKIYGKLPTITYISLNHGDTVANWPSFVGCTDERTNELNPQKSQEHNGKPVPPGEEADSKVQDTAEEDTVVDETAVAWTPDGKRKVRGAFGSVAGPLP